MNENEADSIPAPAHADIARLAGQGCIAAQGSAQRETGDSPAVSAIPPRPDWLKPAQMPQSRKQPPRPNSFSVMRAVVHDDKSALEDPPPAASPGTFPGVFYQGSFVPVSFVAKDWGVTPRRIRALLAGGRLAGRLQDNGYWEVHFPYLLTLGTRGPGLKRQQRQPDKPKNPELRAV